MSASRRKRVIVLCTHLAKCCDDDDDTFTQRESQYTLDGWDYGAPARTSPVLSGLRLWAVMATCHATKRFTSGPSLADPFSWEPCLNLVFALLQHPIFVSRVHVLDIASCVFLVLCGRAWVFVSGSLLHLNSHALDRRFACSRTTSSAKPNCSNVSPNSSLLPCRRSLATWLCTTQMRGNPCNLGETLEDCVLSTNG